MSDRPTPETDAAQRKCLAAFCVDADFARNLERQRDEARELARVLRDALGKVLAAFIPVMEANDWKSVEDAHHALTKAKEVLP